MADIKNYLREREKREQGRDGYKSKIRKYRLTSVYRVLLGLVALLAVILLVYVQYRRHIYTDYDIVGSVLREKASDALDIRLKDTILTYSKDGAHCTDGDGEVIWNQTYEIQDVQVATCGGMVALGNYNGRNIYLGSTKEQLGSITTTMPIKDLAVAENGNVTAILSDSDVTWISTYNVKGENIYNGQTHIENSGYPVEISLSPNGELLAVSYVYIDAGVLKTNVAFYNFGPVGSNQSDYVVGVQIYQDMLVPVIQFMNNDTAFAVGDSRLMFYKGDQKPVSAGEYLYDREIQSVFYNDEYVGVVFRSNKAESKYEIRIYNTNAEFVGEYYFNMEYNDILFEEKAFIIYNETECMITTFDGTEKYNGTFSKAVNLMLPTGGAYKYVLVTDNTIDTIQLK